MRAYLGDLDDVTAGDFEPFNAVNFGNYNTPHVDAGVIPTDAVNGVFALVLDYRPQVGSISVAIDGVPATLGLWPVLPQSAGSVSIDYLAGVLYFHSSDAGLDVEATYKHHGSVLDAGSYNAMQVAVAAGGGGAWGSITGDLSDQTDLQSALDGKLNLSDTSQSISGDISIAGHLDVTSLVADTVGTRGGGFYLGEATLGDAEPLQFAWIGDTLHLIPNSGTVTVDADKFSGDGSGITGILVSNVAGLQSALDDKAGLGANTFTGVQTATAFVADNYRISNQGFTVLSPGNLILFDIRPGTNINGLAEVRFGRGTNTGSGAFNVMFYKGDGTNTPTISFACKEGDVQVSGRLRIGGGSWVTNVLSVTASVAGQYPVGTGQTYSRTVTVTGAASGDTVIASPPAGWDVGDAPLIHSAFVSAANTVTIRVANTDTVNAGEAITGTWRITVIKF